MAAPAVVDIRGRRLYQVSGEKLASSAVEKLNAIEREYAETCEEIKEFVPTPEKAVAGLITLAQSSHSANLEGEVLSVLVRRAARLLKERTELTRAAKNLTQQVTYVLSDEELKWWGL